MPETIIADDAAAPASQLPRLSTETDRRRTHIRLTAQEAQGIAAILADPQPPTEELKRAWREYQAFAAAHPDAGW